MATERLYEPAPQPPLVRLLADATRWRLVSELRWSDWQVHELSTRLDLPQNLVSYHLALLRQAGLVRSHRSDADGRALYYGIDSGGMQRSLRALQHALGLGAGPLPEAAPSPVLFVCTHNSARSQIAEGWLRHLAGDQVAARSAGTFPASVHPLAVQVMAEAGIDISHQRAKALADLQGFVPAVVVTVCDRAREQCAAQPAAPIQIHWSVPDPVAVTATPADQLAAFRAARDDLRVRVTGLLELLAQQ